MTIMEKSQLILESKCLLQLFKFLWKKYIYFFISVWNILQLQQQYQQQQKSLYPEIWSVKVLHNFMDADLTHTLVIHLIFI